MSPEAVLQSNLQTAISLLGRPQVAALLDINSRTLSRWETGNIPSLGLVSNALENIIKINSRKVSDIDADFTFIDLFAGIGGIRLGFEAAGGQCVYTSEWNKYAAQTYTANFKPDHPIAGDITEVEPADIPDHDVLLAGFPCQPFSIAGVSKKNSLGKAHGFACEAQGTLFFDIANILRIKQPSAFLLENVKNLMSHDKGRTFKVIKKTLEEELGYTVFPLVIDAKGFVPQHRERIYIVGFQKGVPFSWNQFNKPDPASKRMSSVLHPENANEHSEHDIQKGYITGKKRQVNDKYTLSDKLWLYLQNYAAKHKAKGNGFGYGMVGPDDTARTLSARYYKDGSEILVSRGKDNNPRRLTPRECARLMGYPDDFVIPVSDTQAYKQFGNSVAVPVVEEVARVMKPFILQLIEEKSETKQKAVA